MSPNYRRINSIIPLIATVSLLGKEGYFYKLDAANQAVIVAAATDVPHGVILATSEDGLEISAAPLGGNHGTILLKLGADVTDLRKDLTVRADGSVESDDATGARVIVARPLETGATDEMIECVVLPARKIGAAVVATSTNGTAAAAVDLAALKAEAENIGDDVRAILAALQTAGFLT
ncbi:hypothetical protein BH09VER1_BH09VER1_24610 [soil metagenome]